MDNVTDLIERLQAWGDMDAEYGFHGRAEELHLAATTLETLAQENARLREALKQAVDAPMIDHNDSSRSVYGILRKALGGGDEA